MREKPRVTPTNISKTSYGVGVCSVFLIALRAVITLVKKGTKKGGEGGEGGSLRGVPCFI